jgi:hypothetical protein
VVRLPDQELQPYQCSSGLDQDFVHLGAHYTTKQTLWLIVPLLSSEKEKKCKKGIKMKVTNYQLMHNHT